MRVRNLAATLTLVILGLSFTALPTLDAQAPSDMTYLRVSVIDKQKEPVATLKAEDFQLTEDKKAQKITYFSGPGDPASLSIILGLSASGPVKVGGQNDRVSLDITNAVTTVRDTFGPSSTTFEQVPFDSDGMYNVVMKNMENLAKQANPRKAMIVISDGLIPSAMSGDRMPIPRAMTDAAREGGFPIFFLFPITNYPEPQLLERNNYATGYFLQQIAEYSGGDMVVGQIENNLSEVSQKLRDTVKNMYILGYNSTNKEQNGKWRKLEVKLTPEAGKNLKVSARSRYFVPKPE